MTFSPVTFSSLAFSTRNPCARPAPVVITVTIKIEIAANGCVKVTT
jgi:hypothetical protein